jgi:hypothetical protein
VSFVRNLVKIMKTKAKASSTSPSKSGKGHKGKGKGAASGGGTAGDGGSAAAGPTFDLRDVPLSFPDLAAASNDHEQWVPRYHAGGRRKKQELNSSGGAFIKRSLADV